MPHASEPPAGITHAQAGAIPSLAAPASPFGTPDVWPVYSAEQAEIQYPDYWLRMPEEGDFFAAVRRYHLGQRDGGNGSRWTEFRDLLRRFADLCRLVARVERMPPPAAGDPATQAVGVCGAATVFVESSRGARSGLGPATSEASPASDRDALSGALRNARSLGTALHFLLYGRWPQRGHELRGASLADARRLEVPGTWHRTRPSEALASLPAICEEAMSGRPSDRTASAEALAATIMAWRDEQGLQLFYEQLRVASSGGQAAGQRE